MWIIKVIKVWGGSLIVHEQSIIHTMVHKWKLKWHKDDTQWYAEWKLHGKNAFINDKKNRQLRTKHKRHLHKDAIAHIETQYRTITHGNKKYTYKNILL